METLERTPGPRDEPHWYMVYIGQCPVCGRDTSYPRERQPGPRPERWEDRHTFMDDRHAYCGCLY